jgi:FkbM family methyltransferase
LLRLLGRLGVLDVIAQYRLGRVQFGVPLCRLAWDLSDVVNYEAKLINGFCSAIAPLENITLFDCGADIGTFSALVCSRTNRIVRIVAFEPNLDTRDFLTSNLLNLSVPFEVITKAVSHFEGRGRLERPEYDATDHARFLVSGEGPIEVTTIDRMNVRGGDVAIKLDLEGGELDALKGAAETIASARQCVVTIEAHPAVAKRIGRDPVEALRFLESVRPFRFVVAETGEWLSTSSGIIGRTQSDIWNVVGWTSGDAQP